MINGVTQLFMMKADVLNSFDSIKVCVGYEVNGEVSDKVPFDVEAKINPQFKEFSGWQDELGQEGGFKGLPEAFQRYVQFIEEEVEVPISIISYGPDRDQTLMRNEVVA